MSFLSLLQAIGAFLRSARDLVVCGCGLPYDARQSKRATKRYLGVEAFVEDSQAALPPLRKRRMSINII
jgi:hypothetical protein